MKNVNAKVGDTLHVFDVNGKRYGWPADGYIGTVTKAGPKLFTVVYGDHKESTVFRRDTGRSNDQLEHRSVKTPEQVALERRHDEAVKALKEHGIELEWRSKMRLTVEQLEALADVARTFPAVPE